MPIVVAEIAHGFHGAGGRIFVYGGIGLSTGFVPDGGGLDGPDAFSTPGGDGHFLDEAALGIILRPKVGGQGVEEIGEAVAVFVIDEDCFGEDAVPG